MARQRSKIAIGIVFVLLSAVGLATQNVISRLFFIPGSLFGLFNLGGWIDPQVSNIAMLLAIRMALMALMLAGASPLLYSRTFSAIQQLSKDFKLLAYTASSGLCLFLGLMSLYFSLSQISAGVAIAIFFIYPAITLLLAWRFLQQRPQFYQLSLVPIIFSGIALTTANATASSTATGNPTFGIFGSLVAGLSFGVYGIFAEIVLQPQKSQQGLHPIPFSLITFFTVSTLASISLFFMSPMSVEADSWQPTLLMTILSALITVVAYVLNNFGIRLIGASLTALISASTPALTALFALFALQESLQPHQILGIVIVTAGVAALSFQAKQQRSEG